MGDRRVGVWSTCNTCRQACRLLISINSGWLKREKQKKKTNSLDGWPSLSLSLTDVLVFCVSYFEKTRESWAFIFVCVCVICNSCSAPQSAMLMRVNLIRLCVCVLQESWTFLGHGQWHLEAVTMFVVGFILFVFFLFFNSIWTAEKDCQLADIFTGT